MIKKPIILFQHGNTISTPWDDATNSWNNDVNNHGFWMTAKPAASMLSQFKKQPKEILFKRNESTVEGDFDFIFTRPMLSNDNPLNLVFTKGVDIKWMIEWLDSNKKKYLGYGTFIKEGVDLIQDGVFYTRNKFPGGHVQDAMNNEWYTTDDNPFANVVTWFYAYKLNDLPIYIIVFNPTMTVLGTDIEFETDRYRFRIMDSHWKDFGNQLLKPGMSKNAFPLEFKWYAVTGEEFEFDIGAQSFVRLSYGEQYPEDSITVMSDLIVTHIENTKYKARFHKGQYSAYLSFRMNTSCVMDLTFINSGNRLVYNTRISRHYEEE